MQPGFMYPGTLYLGFYRNGLKVWSQPGGAGTPVVPQAPQQFPQVNQGYYQVPMTYPSLYVAGCGHSFNTYEVFKVYDPYTQLQAALLSCPVCSYVQQVIEPYSNYQNYEDTPIVVA